MTLDAPAGLGAPEEVAEGTRQGRLNGPPSQKPVTPTLRVDNLQGPHIHGLRQEASADATFRMSFEA